MENGLKMVSIRLVDEPPIYSQKKILRPDDVVELLVKDLETLDRELFFVINLRTSGQVINANIATMGTLNTCLYSPREIFKSSILSNAASVILAHNHPSGECKPSNMDLICTKRLAACGEIIGIPVLDHIIIGKDTYLSMKEENIMPDGEKVYETIFPDGKPAYEAILAESGYEYGKKQVPGISFYVAECMEFPTMGRVYECKKLEQAVKIYRSLPKELANMGNGIGFTIHDSKSIYEGDFELMSGNCMYVDIINSIPYYRDSSLVQKAIKDIKRLMPELEVIEPVQQHKIHNLKEKKQGR